MRAFLRLETIAPKIFVGLKIRTTLLEQEAFRLWSGFMPRRKEIANAAGPHLFSIERYEPGHFDRFDPARPFEKWAAVEVQNLASLPGGMDALHLPGGGYAVFLHRGPASAAPATFEWIFTHWLPASGYTIDDRPHFEVMDERYRGESPDSEEEFWVPVREATGG